MSTLSDHLRASTSQHGPSDQQSDHSHSGDFRDIHALTPPRPPPPPPLPPNRSGSRRREAWDTSSHISSNMSMRSEGSENFTSISREFNALVLAGSEIGNSTNSHNNHNNNNYSENYHMARIGEEDTPYQEYDNNPLAIVPDNNPLNSPVPSPRRGSYSGGPSSSGTTSGAGQSEISVQRVKKEEVETKISAWQNAKVAKINNRFKRDDAMISGWENEEVQKATSWMKKVERKLEEKRARALEKMENRVAKAHRKAEERRASAGAKRGTKVASVLEVANLMRAVGKAPTKRSFF